MLLDGVERAVFEEYVPLSSRSFLENEFIEFDFALLWVQCFLWPVCLYLNYEGLRYVCDLCAMLVQTDREAVFCYHVVVIVEGPVRRFDVSTYVLGNCIRVKLVSDPDNGDDERLSMTAFIAELSRQLVNGGELVNYFSLRIVIADFNCCEVEHLLK